MSATDEYPSTPPPIITTTTFIPYPTSQQQQPQPGSFFTGSGLSTPLLAGSISVGAFGLAIIAICIWFKYMGRNSPDTVVRRFVERMLPARVRRRRLEQLEEEEEEAAVAAAAARHRRRGSRQSRRGRGSERGWRSRARPRMFDAWIETVDDALKKWEVGESVPLAARVLTRGSSSSSSAGAAAGTNEAEVSSRVGGRDSICEEKEGQQIRQGVATGSSTTLQVAVLLQMPSPPARHSVTDAQNDISVRDELVIGLVEAPWTREQPSSREGEETTTNLSHA